MGDIRFERPYQAILASRNRVEAIRSLSDAGAIEALAAAAASGDLVTANVLTTEATNRLQRATTIGENIGEGVLAIDRRERISFVNSAAMRILDVTREDLVGKELSVLARFEDTTEGTSLEGIVRGILQEGRPREAELLLERPPGEPFRMELTAVPILVEGELTGAVITFRDTTERRRALEAQARLAAIVQASADGIISKNLQGIITSWNQGAERIFGYAAEEALGQSATMLFLPEDRHLEAELLARVSNGEALELPEVRRVRKGGSIIWIRLSVAPIMNAQGEVTGAAALQHDITERKQMEEALRQSEARYRLLADTASDVIGLSRQGIIEYVSPACRRVLGYEPEEMLGRSSADFVHPDDVARLLSVGAAILGPEDRFTIEYRGLRKDGTYVWLEATGHAQNDPATGKVTATVSTSRDITERKRMEEALRESEARFRHTLERSPMGTGLVSPEGRWLLANAALCEVLGYPREELEGMTIEDVTHPEDREGEGTLMAHLKDGIIHDYQSEKRCVSKEAQTIWVNESVALLRDAAGVPQYFIVQLEDITARKRMGEMLAEALRERGLPLDPLGRL